jgi:hypothetical protein
VARRAPRIDTADVPHKRSPLWVMRSSAAAVSSRAMGHVREASPSVARALSELEAECLAAIALALPSSWVVVIEPPFGQVAITPVSERPRFHRSWVASGSQRRIYRDDSRGEAWRGPSHVRAIPGSSSDRTA